MTMSSTLCSQFLNGTSNQTQATVTLGTPTTLYIGNSYVPSLTYAFTGQMGEVIVYNQTLSDAQRQAVEGYLAWKWSVNTSLVATHPFYRIKPFATYFNPSYISNLAVWFDGADSSTITTSAGVITQWNDKSSNAWTATTLQGTAPTNTTVNGLNAVSFSGSSSLTVSNVTLPGNAHAIFIVYKVASATNYISFFDCQSPSAGGIGILNYTYPGSGDTVLLASNAGGDTSILQINGAPNVGFTNQIGIVQSANAIASNYITQNGTSYGFTVYSNIGSTYTSSIGTYYIGNAYPQAYTLCEYIMYLSEFTLAQRIQMEGYLAWKWGTSLTAPSGGASFISTPTSISGCVLWLDATDTSTINASPPSASTTVTAWRDKSGSANNPTIWPAAGGTYSNYWSSTGINGKGAMYLSNSAAGGSAPGGTIGSAIGFKGGFSTAITGTVLTAFAVVCSAGTQLTTRDQRIISLSPNSTTADYTTSTGVIPFDIQATTPSNNFFTYRNGMIGSNAALITSSAFVATSQYTGANGYLWVNGTPATQTGTASSGSFGINNYGIGADAWSTGTGEGFYGYIGEILIYSNSLSTADRLGVQNYLANKWGITLTTPSTPAHSFYSIPTSATVPFLPTSIPGCSLWLDANDPAGTGTQPSAGALSTWKDKSGSSNHMTAAGTTPTFSSAPPTAVTFGGAGYYSNATPVFSNSYTAFFVYKQTAAAFGPLYIGPLYTTGATSGSNGLFPNEAGTTYFTRGDSTWYTMSSPFASNVTNLAGVSFSSNVVGSNQSLFYNGSNVVTTTQANTITYTNLLIGSRQSGGTEYFTGSIYEVVAYGGTLTTNDRQRVEGYLAWKWNLVTSLPAGHPYLKFPPAVS